MTEPGTGVGKQYEGGHGLGSPSSFELWLAKASICVLAGLLVYLLIGVVLYRFWHPDVSAVFRELDAATIVPFWEASPEPREQLLFLVVIFSSPLLLLAGWRIFSGGRTGRLVADHAPVINLLATGLFLALAIAAFAAKNPEQIPATGDTFAAASQKNLGFYLYNTFIYEHIYLYALIIFPFCLLVLSNCRIQRYVDRHQKAVDLSIGLFAVGIGVWMFLETTYRFPYTEANKYDLSAVIYPVAQVYYGAQLLTDNFVNNYGLYPQFLLPLFRLIGLNFLTFSATMAMITIISFGIFLLVLRRLIANRFLLLSTFAAVVFYVYCYARINTPHNPYFANIPIRLIFPMIALGLSLWCRRGMRRSWTVAALVLLAVGVLWAPDFGLMSYVAFTAYLVYLEVDLVRPRRTVAALVKIISVSGLTLLGVALVYVLFMGLIYGDFPDLKLLFSTMKLYSTLGVSMMPMPLIHPWNLVAITFAGGLLATLPPLVHGDQDEQSARIFLLTLLGIGAFSYYQGRSHNWNLLIIEIYAIPLWGIFCDRLLNHLKRGWSLYLPWAVSVFVLGTAVPQLAYASPKLATLVRDSEERLANLAVQQNMERNAEFIRRGTVPGERVQIFSGDFLPGLYHVLAQRGAAFNPSYINLNRRDDFNRFLGFLQNNASTKVYYEYSKRLPLGPLNVDAGMMVVDLLRCCYVPVESNDSMMLLGKKSDADCTACMESKGIELPPPHAPEER